MLIMQWFEPTRINTKHTNLISDDNPEYNQKLLQKTDCYIILCKSLIQ